MFCFIFLFALQSNSVDNLLTIMLSPGLLDTLVDRLYARINAGGCGGVRPNFLRQRPAVPSSSSPLPTQKHTPIPFPVHNSLPTLTASSEESLSRSSTATTLGYDSEVEHPFSQEFSEDDVDSDRTDFVTSYDSIIVKRGAKVEYTEEDKLVVNFPIMRLIDSTLLAPIKSTLFMFQRKKGSKEFKKNADMVFDKFKEIVKPVIRGLVTRGRDVTGNVVLRYFWCAYDLVRKRRANHIQSWRTNNYPKDLIYGGRDQFVATYGDPWALNQNRNKKRRKRKRE